MLHRGRRLAAGLLLAAALAVPCQAAEPVRGFTAADFGGASGILLTDLSDGFRLTLGGRTLRPGDALTAGQLAGLQAVSRSETEAALSLSYLPLTDGNTGEETVLTFSLGGTKDQPPVAHDSRAETYKNLSIDGTLDCADPEGGPLIYLLLTAPKRGQVVFHRDGTFTYTPDREKVGTDSFTYAVEDGSGNRSAEARVSITIRRPVSDAVFADMAGEPQEFEALFLRNEGIFSGEVIGGALCFGPDKPVTEREFLMMLMALTGLEPETAATGGWFAPWQEAALRAGLPMEDSAVFTREDAAAVTACLLELTEDTAAACFSGSAASAMTRRDAARLLYAVHCRCEEEGIAFPWQTS